MPQPQAPAPAAAALLDQIAGAFPSTASSGASIEQVAHRLSTLQRPGSKGIPFFFVRVDQAGTITKRHSATRLQFARFGGACHTTPCACARSAVPVRPAVVDGCGFTKSGASPRRGSGGGGGSCGELSDELTLLLLLLLLLVKWEESTPTYAWVTRGDGGGAEWL